MEHAAAPRKCCRAVPRCRSCPVTLRSELADVRQQLTSAATKDPPHLAGIPRCLHKYEPLFRETQLEG